MKLPFHLTPLLLTLLLTPTPRAATTIGTNGEVMVYLGTTGTKTVPSSQHATNTVTIVSTAPATSPALSVATTLTHTSGNLVEVQNNGTNVTEVSSTGGVFASQFSSHLNATLLFDSVTDASTVPFRFTTQTDHVGGTTLIDVKDAGTVVFQLRESGEIRSIGSNGGAHLSRGSADVYLYPDFLEMYNGTDDLVFIDGTGDDTSTVFTFNTGGLTHTSGNLLELRNNTTNYVQVNADQSATNTPLTLNINGTLKRVHVGISGSGGIGLRALTVED